MKGTLKKVAIFAAIVFFGAVGALAGYVLITKNKTYYIYDLRIVQPIDDATSYVYTDKEIKYTSLKNQKVYMTTQEENYIPIAVYLNVSTNTRKVEITSSNTNVAKIVYQDNKCFVNCFSCVFCN